MYLEANFANGPDNGGGGEEGGGLEKRKKETEEGTHQDTAARRDISTGTDRQRDREFYDKSCQFLEGGQVVPPSILAEIIG